METVFITKTIEVDWQADWPSIPKGETELEFEYELAWENDGVGKFEYWGHKCFDKGKDYLVHYNHKLTGILVDGKWVKIELNLFPKKVLDYFDSLAENENVINEAVQQGYNEYEPDQGGD